MYAAHAFNETHTFGHTHTHICAFTHIPNAQHEAAAAVVAAVLCFCKVSVSYICMVNIVQWQKKKKRFICVRVYIVSMMGIYQPVGEPSSVIMNFNVLI